MRKKVGLYPFERKKRIAIYRERLTVSTAHTYAAHSLNYSQHIQHGQSACNNFTRTHTLTYARTERSIRFNSILGCV